MPILLDENFSGPVLDQKLRWFCEPAHWRTNGGNAGLTLRCDAATDFWQRTHYGFQADNGHCLFAELAGDARVETRVRYKGLHQYDQAGLMLRYSPGCWLKASVEFEPEGPNRLGAVVTRHGYSDWSTQDIDSHFDDFRFRLTRTGADCLVEASVNGAAFTQLRVAHLDEGGADTTGGAAPAQIGLYACSPKEAGFEAVFEYLRIATLP
ncbi:MAG: DUF1349 domain-containing protein [Bryobacterales bacterium]|nr:DUF1349 domain-containing protein [Bryobacterales bacterium]